MKQKNKKGCFSKFGAIARIAGCLALICFGSLVFWYMEADVAKTDEGMKEALGCVVELPYSSRTAAYDGKLVHATGIAAADEVLTDDEFGIRHQGINLERVVEFYQWNEIRSTRTIITKNSKREVVEYSHKKMWVSTPVDTLKFKRGTPDLQNSVSYQTEKKTWLARHVDFGAYTIPQSRIGHIRDDKPYSLDGYRIPDSLQGRAKVDDNHLYIGPAQPESGAQGDCTVNPAHPRIGDVRIRWVVTAPKTTVSLAAKLQGNSFVPYVAKANKYKVDFFCMGEKTMDEMCAIPSEEIWAGRIFGWITISLGIMWLISPYKDDLVYARGNFMGRFLPLYIFVCGVGSISLIIFLFAWHEYQVVLSCLLLADAWLVWKCWKRWCKEAEPYTRAGEEYIQVELAVAGQDATGPLDKPGQCAAEGCGAERGEEEAAARIRKAAEPGDADALYELGERYYYGTGGKKNTVQAVAWYRKAAELGHADAMYELGECYYYGTGVTKNMEQAVEWYRKATELGHAGAMYRLGGCYYLGKGVEVNEEQAVEWYRKAAELGHADAMYGLGECYYYGHGVEENEKQAVEWYRKAAELGQTDAMHMLAKCYSRGTGVRQDAREAAKWVRRAKEQDDTGIE